MSYFSQVSLKNPPDYWGEEVEITPMGQLKVATAFKIAGSSFANGDTTLDSNFWLSTAAGAGGTSTTDLTTLPGALHLDTTANANYGRTITSSRIARYISGSSNQFRAILKVSAPNADNVRRWGIGSAASLAAPSGLTIPVTGAYWEFNGTTINIVTVVGSSPTAVPQANWNGTAFTMDTNFHTYEIYYTNKKIYWTIDGVLVHTTTVTTTPWTSCIHGYIYFTNYNVASVTANTMDIMVVSVNRLGELDTDTKSAYSTTAGNLVCKRGPGRVIRIISGAVVNSTITVYDNTTNAGTIIGVFSTNSTAPAVIELGVPFTIGLTVELGNNAQEITVVYE